MDTVPATEFKARCLELMDRVAEGRETYVITKRGRPVAKLVPPDPPAADDIFGCMADETEIVGDLGQPLLADGEWRALERERSRQWKALSVEGGGRARRGARAKEGSATRHPKRGQAERGSRRRHGR